MKKPVKKGNQIKLLFLSVNVWLVILYFLFNFNKNSDYSPAKLRQSHRLESKTQLPAFEGMVCVLLLRLTTQKLITNKQQRDKY